MEKNTQSLKSAGIGEVVFGFEVQKIESVESKDAVLYTLRHKKTGTELLYFDREDENKTFAVCFKTLPEDNTGVFHILEHSVLNGSDKFPVKEPFVALLQSSLQTFLNAMTYSDKTVYPVSSRNEQDFFNLVSVYLDGVFHPMIYKRPEIFMQEGWHYEFESPEAEPYYNGVVYSEMKGVFASADAIMEEESRRLLFPDTSYGYISGGHPDHITDLTYEQFIETHKRFYHPSNAKMILDGTMDVDAVLEYIDAEYLSNYEYRKNDFDFVEQTPTVREKTVTYEAQEGEEDLSHMAIGKIFGRYDDLEKIYAAEILADYLVGSNEAPLKRAFLENGLAQDVSITVAEDVLQPYMALIVNNTNRDCFENIKRFLAEKVHSILKQGLDQKALRASIEKMAFSNREIHAPHGLELSLSMLESWLYGGNPLAHIDNDGIFESLQKKAAEGYFEELLSELLGDASDKSYLYVLPSLTKGEEDAQREQEKIAAAIADWDEKKAADVYAGFEKMVEWQMSADSEEALCSLPHLSLADIPEEAPKTETALKKIGGRDVLSVRTNTNGIVYLNLFFDLSDFTLDELRLMAVLAGTFGELRTKDHSAQELQTEIKATLGELSAKIEFTSKQGDIACCTPYFAVFASMLEENADNALDLIKEILVNGQYDESERLYELLVQSEYALRQDLIEQGHIFAIRKALSAASEEDALKEQILGESYVRWFSGLVEGFAENAARITEKLGDMSKKAFAGNRLFAGYSGNMADETIARFIDALPETEIGPKMERISADGQGCAVEIPASVGFSAYGHNLYALGGEFSGGYSVAANLMTYGYLWNEVRVQGGAYGTGMNVNTSGDIYCYSYRDPNLENTRAVYAGAADFLEEFLSQGMPLDDSIIGTVNTTDPLLSPSEICTLECERFLRGMRYEQMSKTRKEILHTTNETLMELVELFRRYAENAKFCAIGDKASIAFADAE